MTGQKPKTVAVPAAAVLQYYGLQFINTPTAAPAEQSAADRARRLVDAASKRAKRQMRRLARRGGA